MKIGCSKNDITPKTLNIGMMGWAQTNNKVNAVFMPLNARAFIFFDDKKNKKVVFVCAEIAFTTISIKQGVIKKLEIDYPELNIYDENLMINATHTHSAPGGYSHYLLYNLSIPGYEKEVEQKYIDGIVSAIVKAHKNLEKGTVFFNKGEIALNKRVAFNRSIEAYNQNPEVKKVNFENRNSAINREMKLLYFENENKESIGMINWFAVHNTNIHSDNYLIHSDNKGYAAEDFEKINNVIGAFAQSHCGDVTPNFQYFEGIKFCRGEFEDDFKSAKYNGLIQSEKANKLFKNKKNRKKLDSEIDYIQAYINFSNVNVSSEFTNGLENQKTSPGAIGVSMLQGTSEGPGISKDLGKTLEFLVKVNEKRITLLNNENKQKLNEIKKWQGKKVIFAETGEKKILGLDDLEKLAIPSSIDPVIGRLKDLAKKRALGNEPWTPQILPIQIFIIGSIAIIAVPAEFTTIAGKRLKETVLNVLQKRGIDEIIFSGYSNAYSGYVTTKEEYDLQNYEGGSTHFGMWTLAAYQTEFKKLAIELLKPKEERKTNDLKPIVFSQETLEKRTFI